MNALIFRPWTNYSLQPFWPFFVYNHHCRTDLDYARALRDLWPIGADLIVMEHDIRPPFTVVEELADCPEVACVPMYRLYPVSTGLPEEHWAHRDYNDAGQLRFIPEWQRWVPFAGLGLAKLSYRLRAATPPPPLVVWHDLDSALSRDLNTTWHVHKVEVEHLHR